ncbi:hypothetical protein [Rhodoblastus sp.]|uniref:hypothetical protein n=1 Tax=Rhodoblastus sp. TaxID=1962975 RepID=UPI0035AED9C8
MSDQNGGKTEADDADSGRQAAAGAETAPAGAKPGDMEPKLHEAARDHVPPVIEGEATEIAPEGEKPSEDIEAAPAAAAESKSEPIPAEPGQPAEEAPRRGGALVPVAVLIGAVALGGGGYYLWNAQQGAAPEATTAQTTAAPIAAPKPAAPAEPPARIAQKPPEPTPPAPTPPKSEAPAAAPAENKPVAPAPAANAATDKAVAEMAAKLAATQSLIERLNQRLQAVETQLSAPKDEARATLSERDASASAAGEAAARLVVAQSLLSALRQGDDFSAQLAALQNFGANPARLAPLRAGLTAPTPSRLATDFAALAPKLVAAATPAPKESDAKPSPDAHPSVWAYIQAQTRRFVRIRPAGAPDKDAAEQQVDKITQDLHAGDLAKALADRQQLPAAALALTADWATAAQARLAAEAAAKAELAEALQNLTKTKS